MDRVNHPHDKLFKEAFGDLKVTTNFMNHFLPEEILALIDVDSLTLLKESSIQSELKDSYSNLLFRAKIGDEEGYLYFLFEHKSYPATDIALQLLGYRLQIWNQHLLKEQAATLPIIIPILFYHGERKWERAKKIDDWITGYNYFPPSIQKYVPDFFYDFSFDGKEGVNGDPKLRAYLQLSRHIFIKDVALLIKVIITIEELLSEYDPSYFDTVMIYLFNARDDLPIETLKEQLTTEGRKRLISIAEQLRKEGELKKSREMAKKLLLLNIDKEQIIEVTDLTIKEIEQIKQEMQ